MKSSNIQQRINKILADDRPDAESVELSKTEAIEALIGEFGWEVVRECMLDLLRDDTKKDQWHEAVHVFWGAVLDHRPLPADELIAWLYHRFDPDGKTEDNEVWSITSKLKGKSYLSKYKPLQDPAVLKHLRAIRGR
jgi:hypothetical protein